MDYTQISIYLFFLSSWIHFLIFRYSFYNLDGCISECRQAEARRYAIIVHFVKGVAAALVLLAIGHLFGALILLRQSYFSFFTGMIVGLLATAFEEDRKRKEYYEKCCKKLDEKVEKYFASATAKEKGRWRWIAYLAGLGFIVCYAIMTCVTCCRICFYI